MEAWLFDIMMWPHPGEARALYPFPGRLYDRELGRALYQDHLAFFVRAEELGFDAVCFTEHHYGPNGLCPSPNVMAAAVAARTSHVKLALVGNCLPMHAHPVRVAEEIAMLDNLSNGRVIAGLFRGGFLEFYAYNVDVSQSRERFEEAWQLIVRAWTSQEPFEWKGRYYHYDVVSILPRPLQEPHPPIVLAGHTPETVQWAAKQRVPLAVSFGSTDTLARTFDYYREYAQTHCGWRPGPDYCMVSRQVYVAASNARARAQAEEHIMTFYRESPVLRRYEGKLEALRQTMMTERGFSYRDGEGRRNTSAAAGEMSFERFQREGFCIIGDPDYVVAEIRRQQKALGVGTILIYLPFGTMSVSQATKSLELFAREVLPNLRETVVPRQ